MFEKFNRFRRMYLARLVAVIAGFYGQSAWSGGLRKIEQSQYSDNIKRDLVVDLLKVDGTKENQIFMNRVFLKRLAARQGWMHSIVNLGHQKLLQRLVLEDLQSKFEYFMENFERSELEGILEFYSSSTGKKYSLAVKKNLSGVPAGTSNPIYYEIDAQVSELVNS